jgi:regulator of protease activity HflC (stomatin/prohibitin superfamily)
MLDRLIDLLQVAWTHLVPCFTVEPYEAAVRVRLGRLHGGVLTNGFHWKIPLADKVTAINIAVTTLDLSEQTVTTANGVQLVIESAVKYEVTDPVKAILEVFEVAGSIADMSKGIIRSCAVASDWPLTNGEDFEKEVNRRIKLECKKWGIKVHTVSIISLGAMKSIRLIQTTSTKYDTR